MRRIYLLDMLACLVGPGIQLVLAWQIMASQVGESSSLEHFAGSFYISNNVWNFFWDLLWPAVWMLVRLILAWFSYLRNPAMIAFVAAVAVARICDGLLLATSLLHLLTSSGGALYNLVLTQCYVGLGIAIYNTGLLTLILVLEWPLLQNFLLPGQQRQSAKQATRS